MVTIETLNGGNITITTGSAGHLETRFTLESGTVNNHNITGTLDQQWMSTNGYYEYDEEGNIWSNVITQADIGNTVTSIGNDVFTEAVSLTSVTIPASVTRIGSYAFSNCSELTSMTIGNGLTSIGDYAFDTCINLTSVTIPDSVTSIGSNAFYDCRGLTSVHITDLTKWCGISFGNSSANPLSYANNLYLNGVKITDLAIPNDVTSIRNYAFYNCSGLTSVTIPDSVTGIGESVFFECDNLMSVTFEGKNKATVQGMSNYPFGLNEANENGVTIHCTDGDIQVQYGDGGDDGS